MLRKEKIVVYTTSVCPYCTSAKKLLKEKGYIFSEIDVSEDSLRNMLVKMSNGRKTVPQIFIGDMHVGGYDDLTEFSRTGELDEIMENI